MMIESNGNGSSQHPLFRTGILKFPELRLCDNRHGFLGRFDFRSSVAYKPTRACSAI